MQFGGQSLRRSYVIRRARPSRALDWQRPKECFVDRGYRGHEETATTVFIAGQKRGITPRLKRLLKRRKAIEPVIGHMKEDGRLDRNTLKGTTGDAMNAPSRTPPTPNVPSILIAFMVGSLMP